METIRQLLQKLKDAHHFYVTGDNSYQAQLLDALVPIFEKLEKLNVPRSFSESVVIWGKEFVDFVVEDAKKDNTGQIRAKGLALNSSLENVQLGLSGEENKVILNKEKNIPEKNNAYFLYIEQLFGAKVETRTEHEERCFQLAQKHNIKFFDILSKEGQSPKIKDISFNKKK